MVHAAVAADAQLDELNSMRSFRVAACLWLALTSGAAVVSTASTARGNDNAAAAEALFQQGQGMVAKGNYAEACPKFQASYEFDKQLGTLLNWADCLLHEGKVASSWARWEEGIDWAARVEDPRLAFARQQQKLAEGRLPRLTITVTNPVEALRIERDSQPVPEGIYGTPLPIDPGPLTVTVLRGEEVLETRDAIAAEKETTTIALDLRAIEQAHPVLAPPPPPPRPALPVPPPPPSQPYDATQRNVGLIVGGVGIAAVLAAVGLEIGALVKKGQADEPDACVNQFCAPGGLEAAEDAKTFAEVGQWLGIGGLVATVVGTTIFLTSPPEPDDPAADQRVTGSIWSTPHGGGLTLGTRW